MNDTDRLDALQKLAVTEDRCNVVCRWSSTRRGWRLHETSGKDGCDSVRDAIDKFILQNKQWLEGKAQ